MSRKPRCQDQGVRGTEWPRRLWVWLRRLLRRLRWAYWRSSESWPLTMIGQFIRALLLLGLWLLVGSCIVRFLLPYLLPGVQLADKETIALLGTLLTALIGFGIQQWRGLEEEKQRESQKREEALTVIDELTSLIRDNPSEGARRYLEFKAKGGVWQSGQVRARLDEIWEKNAPRELKTAVALMEGSPLKEVEESEIRDALLWAYTHLDDDWRCRAADVLHRVGVSTPQQERLWLSLLRIHPTSSADVDWDRMRGLRQLGLERNPFGAEKAEADPLFLLEVRTYPSWWSKVTPIQSGLFVAEYGGGRTTMALLLAHDLLQSKEAFPVYWKPASVEMSPNHLVQAIAQALVNYIALRPSVYISSAHSARTAIARLLNGCFADPLDALRRAGLPAVGEGQRVLRELESLLDTLRFSRPLLPNDYLPLLNDARLSEFPHTLVLLDIQQEPGESALWHILTLMDPLARTGVFLKVFLPVSPNTEHLGERILWSGEDLKELLSRRFALLGPGETLEAWCELKKWRELPPDDRLIAAARGNPAALIRLGNRLLSRIGQTGHRLTPDDVQLVLEE